MTPQAAAMIVVAVVLVVVSAVATWWERKDRTPLRYRLTRRRREAHRIAVLAWDLSSPCTCPKVQPPTGKLIDVHCPEHGLIKGLPNGLKPADPPWPVSPPPSAALPE